MTLQEFFKEVPKARWPFPAVRDSAFLLWAAREYGADVRAYYGKTAFQPAFELEDARRLARELQVPMTVIEEDILRCRRWRRTARSAVTTANGCCFQPAGSCAPGWIPGASGRDQCLR